MTAIWPGLELCLWASLVAQMVKNLPAIREILVWSLGWEDLLEKGTATHSGIVAWKIPWTEEPGGLQSMGLQRIGHDWVPRPTLLLTFTFSGTSLPVQWLRLCTAHAGGVGLIPCQGTKIPHTAWWKKTNKKRIISLALLIPSIVPLYLSSSPHCPYTKSISLSFWLYCDSEL